MQRGRQDRVRRPGPHFRGAWTHSSYFCNHPGCELFHLQKGDTTVTPPERNSPDCLYTIALVGVCWSVLSEQTSAPLESRDVDI